MKLSVRKVKTLNKPGMYPDGDNLYLQVQVGRKGIVKSWAFRYTRKGRSRQMGLGAEQTFSLAEARDRARSARQLLSDGHDPIERKQAARDKPSVPTFKDATAQYFEAKASGFTDENLLQWKRSLARYAQPVLGKLPVDQIELDDILKVLEPMWTDTTVTASRVQGRIKSILAWATTRKYRSGPNPAAWTDNLEHVLPKPGKVKPKRHHAAIPFKDMAAFMIELAAAEGSAFRALELAILTASRTQEVLGARWEEIEGDLWVVPASRMKARKEHRVPLSPEVQALLENLPRFESGFLFEGRFPGRRLPDTALMHALEKIRTGITTHGFRASFRTWGAEHTSFPSDLLEAALAHQMGKLHDAYQRSDLLEKRRKVMEAWARYALPSEGNVVALRG